MALFTSLSRIFSLSPLPVGLCACLLSNSPVCAEESYDALVRQARAGNPAPALQFLRQHAADTTYLDDHLIIANWAGLDSEVVARREHHPSARLSAAGHAAVAQAYRNLKRWPQALSAYNQGLAVYSGDRALLLGLVMTLADAGRSAEAIAYAQALVGAEPRDAGRQLALAYVLRVAGQPYAALNHAGKALKLEPRQAEVQRGYLAVLEGAGLPRLALERGATSGLLEPAQRRRLQASRVAELVRLADTGTPREDERFVVADRAIAYADELLAQWNGDPQAEGDSRRVRIDRLGALQVRMCMAEILKDYQRLRDEQVELPAYALRWVASAALHQRQPELAERLYRQVLVNETPKDLEWMGDHRGLFYAQVESEQLEHLPALTGELLRQQPKRLYPLGIPLGLPNEDRLDARVLQASAYYYRNDLGAAQREFEALSWGAPGNSRLRTGLASVYLARGWPRRAESQLKLAENVSPRNLPVEVEQGMAALALQEWRQFDLLAKDSIARFPEQLPAQRLNRLRNVHHMNELRIESYLGNSQSSGINGSRSLGFDSAVYSSPIDDNWRLFAGAGYATGKFREGTGHYRWQRTGVEWRSRGNTVDAEVSHNDYGHGDKSGLRLSGAHEIDDHWHYGWSAARLSRETPLRALNSDVRADSLGGFLGWRESEQREWRLSATPSRFSDGNRRLEVVMDGRQRIHETPYMHVDLGLELAGSGNSESADVPYFNPKSDISALPSLNLNHTLYRRYQTHWTQQARIGLGTYSQQGHGTGAIAQVGYGQRLNMDDRLDAGFNLSALSRPYDGERELEYRLVFDLSYRF